MKNFKFLGTLFAILYCCSLNVNAQDKVAKLNLSFNKEDSLNICKVRVTSNDSAVAEVSVNLYVKRMFSLLQIGKSQTTDATGVVSFEFPNDIPADMNGKLIVIAKIEDDDNYANVETKAESDWGAPRNPTSDKIQRSLSAPRDRAPIYFIILASSIIVGIWGTLIYVVLEVWKKRKTT